MHQLRAVADGWRERSQAAVDAFLGAARGVIHVGANLGQERDLYAAHDLAVLWLEPIPEIFSELEQALVGYPRQRALNYLVTDRDDAEYAFHVATNQGASSSILDLAEHQKLWPEVTCARTITLRSRTLPSILRREGIAPDAFDALVLDTQGSELLVLRGSVSLLPHFRFIKTEVADFESYAGCCRLADLEAFCRSQGFRRRAKARFAHKRGVGSYFEVLYAADDPRGLPPDPTV